MRQKFCTRTESGTCNVCFTPCSSCMHLRCMGSKGNEFSVETSRVTAASQCSINEDDALPTFKNKTHDSLQPTTSEASNLLSVNLSRDSLSENAESKENIRPSDIVGASFELDMLPTLCSGEGEAENQISPKPLFVPDHRTLSNKHLDSKGLEGHDNNISSVIRSDDASVSVSYHNKDLGRKNLLCSSALVSSLETEGSGEALFHLESDLVEYPSKDVDTGFGSPKILNNYLSHVENTNLSMPKEAACRNVHNRNLSTHDGANNFPNGQNAPARDTSDVSTKLGPKLEAETNNDGGKQSDEVLNSSDRAERGEKLNESVEPPDIEELATPSVSGDDSDESEILEHDVKVCDICGDAGREDLLAICTRCSDGAEHTYCMREMLLAVPEGDWLCEECKLAEETENQKQDTKSKLKNMETTQSFAKRLMESTGLASASLKRAVETSLGSLKSSSSNRIGTLSRDSSFNSTDKGKIKPAHQTSFDDCSSVGMPENARSRSTDPRLQTPKSTLLKSSSFNSSNYQSKIKLVDGVPQKPKAVQDSSSLDVRDVPSRMISKSMSFKSLNSDSSNPTESKVKMLSSNFSHIQDIKGVKQLKERSVFERKNISKLERPLGTSVTKGLIVSTPNASLKLTPHGDSVTGSSGSNCRESKGAQCDGKFGALSRSTISLAHKGVEIPVTSVRASSSNGMNSASVEQKLDQVSTKEEPLSSSSGTAENPSNIVGENLKDGLPRRESLNSRLRPSVNTGLKNITCQKCKEIGHAAASCKLTNARAYVRDSSSARSIQDGTSTGGKLKAAIEAVMLKKPGLYKKKKVNVQSGGLPTYNGDVSCEMSSQDEFSVLNETQNMISDQGTLEGQANLARDLESFVPAVGKFGHTCAAASILFKMSAIPEHEYIWQGAFKVRRVGKLLDFYAGIQAHLSTCASPKVLQVVNKFPNKITLDEVPRLSTWPRQFHDNGAKDDNIAVYFFAKDLDSYEKNYKGLLDNMIKEDLALKGNFDGVELLIFASTQLPEQSQCWNTLLFMWGVFRGRKSNCSNSLEKSTIPSLSMVPLDKEINSAVVYASENICLPENIDKETTVHDDSCNIAVTTNASITSYAQLNGDPGKGMSSRNTKSEKQDSRPDSKPLSKITTGNELLCTEIKCSSLMEVGIPVMRPDNELEPSVSANGTKAGSIEGEAIQKRGDALCSKEKPSSFKILDVGNQDSCVKGSATEEVVDGMGSDRVGLLRDLNEDIVNVDTEALLKEGDPIVKEINRWQSNNRKRSYSDFSEITLQSPGITNQNTLWNKVDDMLVFGENIGKKLKTGVSLKDGNSLSDSLCSQLGFSPNSSVDEIICDEVSDKKVIFEVSGNRERYFFPVDLNDENDLQLRAGSMLPRKFLSNDDDQLLDGGPNLELALGVKKKSPNMGIRPHFAKIVEEKNVQNKPTDSEQEDSVTPSLTLSLSYPYPEKKKSLKPIPKPEQILPDRPRVNTSLLLFKGFSDN